MNSEKTKEIKIKITKLTDIQDNPYRNHESYMYDDDKITALAESIGDTSFWENLLARQTKEGVVQLSYGHHRLHALKKLVAEGHEFILKLKVLTNFSKKKK